MNEITLRGFVGDNPTTKTVGENRVGEFRLGLSRGHVDQETGERVQQETTWLTVNAWNGVLDAAPAGLSKRDRVVVTGRLYTDAWEKDGQKRTQIKLRADAIAIDAQRQERREAWDNSAAESAEEGGQF